ncbi:Holliday junction resolvase RuvX [Candidatus Vampirococcus lugosii]|uniref:Holliday junction resolvase n=1 Tax=Candidatus Vampirococcus lugosii TaxID=2789015 RepID=A0ABS5QL45_9BACT|nr:Holliday junction resolvase RuvX [Candidatus Vampirococcus lugosii]MBS8121933.1 Holliday junction resolvase [Candidatus Vampirococcus lugosii]
MKKNRSILGIDWGSKYIGISYKLSDNETILPIGYMINDASFLFYFGEVLIKYNVEKIIIGYPNNNEKIQESIDNFIKQLDLIVSEDVEIIKQNEDYSTTKAGEIMGNYRKNETTDTIASMEILKEYLDET